MYRIQNGTVVGEVNSAKYIIVYYTPTKRIACGSMYTSMKNPDRGIETPSIRTPRYVHVCKLQYIITFPSMLVMQLRIQQTKKNNLNVYGGTPSHHIMVYLAGKQQ